MTIDRSRSLNADRLLTEAAGTDARRDTPTVGELLDLPLVPPDGWHELAPFIAERKRLGLSGAVLAGAMSTTPTIVSELERGRRRITTHWLERYTAAVARCREALAERERSA